MKKLLSATLLAGSLAFSLNANTLEECVQAYKAGALDMAEALCTKAAKEDSKSFWANFWLCKTYLDEGEYKKALAPAQKLEKLAKTLKEYSLAYGQQGVVYSYLGDKKQELKYQLKSLDADRKIGDRGEIGTSLHNLGSYYRGIGNFDEAKKQFTEALEYETGKVSLADTYNSLSILYSDQGDIQKATENSQKAVQLSKEGGDFVSSAHYSVGLAAKYINSARYDEAKPLLDSALQIAKDRGARSTESYAFKVLGFLAAKQGDKSSAKRYYMQALEIATATGNASAVADIKNLINELK
jgi:tetratricopeptide (TPR) repeat protein